MRSSECYVSDDLGWPLTPQTTPIFAFFVDIHIFVVSKRRNFILGVQVCCSRDGPLPEQPLGYNKEPLPVSSHSTFLLSCDLHSTTSNPLRFRQSTPPVPDEVSILKLLQLALLVLADRQASGLFFILRYTADSMRHIPSITGNRNNWRAL